jgi:tRNA threonylcarbamoyladenosine dehydratase
MTSEFSRTELLIGKAALSRLKASKVAVFGIGGVGSFVVEGLVRAGVGHFFLVDHDLVCPSNLNRQLIATWRTVGQAKVLAARERILEINPNAEVETRQIFFLPETAADLLAEDLDYVVDAMDTVTAKIELISRARSRVIPVISCMGAGNKLDPTQFEVADIYETSVCPLSRVMRRELKRRGIEHLKVVYSREQPIDVVAITEDEPVSGADGELGQSGTGPAVRGRKRRIPGSISFVPSVAGLIIAAEVVKDLITIENDETKS